MFCFRKGNRAKHQLNAGRAQLHFCVWALLLPYPAGGKSNNMKKGLLSHPCFQVQHYVCKVLHKLSQLMLFIFSGLRLLQKRVNAISQRWTAPITSRRMFWRHTHYSPTTVRSSPKSLRICTTVKLTENMVPGDDLAIFRGTPCKFQGCIHFFPLIFDAGLACSRKTAIGPKNPLLLAFSPGPKKPIFFLRVCTG